MLLDQLAARQKKPRGGNLGAQPRARASREDAAEELVAMEKGPRLAL